MRRGGGSDPTAGGPGDDPARGSTFPAASHSTADIRPPLLVTATATERNASRLRRQFRDWLAIDVSADAAGDLTLVVYEAVANAVEHAYGDHAELGSLRLAAHRTASTVEVTVADEGAWRAPTDDGIRGNGIPLMRSLTRDVRIDRTDRGTVVRLRADVSAVDRRESPARV